MGRSGIRLIAANIVVLLALLYGIANVQRWAWWGTITYFSLFTLSSYFTFSKYSVYDIYIPMNLPEYERSYLDSLTLFQNMKLSGFIAIPMLMTLTLLVYTKPYFDVHKTISDYQ